MAHAVFKANTKLAPFNGIRFKTAEVVTSKMIIRLRGHDVTLAFPCGAN